MFASAKRHSRPVYIELPRDMTLAEWSRDFTRSAQRRKRPRNPGFAAAEAVDWISGSSIGHSRGEELHRFRLQRPLMQFVERSGIRSPQRSSAICFPRIPCLLYRRLEGAAGLKKYGYVERSDCLIQLRRNE